VVDAKTAPRTCVHRCCCCRQRRRDLVGNVSFSPDGCQILIGTRQIVYLHDALNGSQLDTADRQKPSEALAAKTTHSPKLASELQRLKAIETETRAATVNKSATSRVSAVRFSGPLLARGGWNGYWADAFAACSIKRATSSGLETYTAWLAGTSIVSLPARLAMLRSRSGLMLWSRVATSAQLFF
jgi:hypothetical protein